MSKQQKPPCTDCSGKGGHAEDTTGSDGVTRQNWRTCNTCRGTGVR